MNIYSCFEKGCLTIGEKLSRQCRKLLWVIVVFFYGCFIKPLSVSAWKKETAQARVFVLPPFLLLNHLKPQPSKAQRLLPKYQSAISSTLLHFCGDTFVETAVHSHINPA